MKNKLLKTAYLSTGYWFSEALRDLMFYQELGVGQGDLILSSVLTGTGVLGIAAMEVSERLSSDSLMENTGLPDEDELSLDADYQCEYCGDPVKKGDRVLHNGDVYCTREHAEEGKY